MALSRHYMYMKPVIHLSRESAQLSMTQWSHTDCADSSMVLKMDMEIWTRAVENLSWKPRVTEGNEWFLAIDPLQNRYFSRFYVFYFLQATKPFSRHSLQHYCQMSLLDVC